MGKIKKKLPAVILSLVTVLVSFSLPVSAVKESTAAEFIQYPEKALTVFDSSVLQRVSGGADYDCNRGYKYVA